MGCCGMDKSTSDPLPNPGKSRQQRTKPINQIGRELIPQRQELEIDLQKLTKILQIKIINKESAQSQKVIAQKIVQINKNIHKIDQADVLVQDVKAKLQQATINSFCNSVIQQTANIMNNVNTKMNIIDYEQTTRKFTIQKKFMNAGNQDCQDMMKNIAEQQIQDEDAAKLIRDMTRELVATQKKKIDIVVQESNHNMVMYN